MKDELKQLLKGLYYDLIYRFIPLHYLPLPYGLDAFYDINRYVPTDTARIVFDVGANKGQSAQKFLRWFPKAQIYCFEPISNTFTKLCENTKKYNNILCFPLAFGCAKGQQKVLLQKFSENNSLLYTPEMASRVGSDALTEVVTISTLDSFCHEHQIEHIDFLKIDTEGLDLEVLKGAEQLLKANQVTLIQVEAGMNSLNKKHIPLEQFKEYLEERGYLLFGIYGQTPDWKGEARLRFCNPVFMTLLRETKEF